MPFGNTESETRGPGWEGAVGQAQLWEPRPQAPSPSCSCFSHQEAVSLTQRHLPLPKGRVGFYFTLTLPSWVHAPPDLWMGK